MKNFVVSFQDASPNITIRAELVQIVHHDYIFTTGVDIVAIVSRNVVRSVVVAA